MESRKKLPYMSSLTQFECSIIAKFLSSTDKLGSLHLLNSAWHSLIHSHIAWTQLPDFGPNNWRKSQKIKKFCGSFSSLGGIDIPWIGGGLEWPPDWMEKLNTVSQIRAFQGDVG